MKDVVSFDSELLILVNDQDEEIGYCDKLNCHTGAGTLHRAFSLFIFNESGELLLQQRSRNKTLWPLYWSNSCCSHPRQGETMAQAITRRSQQELGMTIHFDYLYKFQYQAFYQNIGAERELCWVFVGSSVAPVRANENEIAGWRFISATDLAIEMQCTPEHFTPWFKLEWQHLTEHYRDALAALHVHLPKVGA